MLQEPASYENWAEFLAARGITRPGGHRLLLVQIAHGRAWALRPAAEAPPCLLAGIVHARDQSEAWFSPGVGASEHLRTLVPMCRAQLEEDQRYALGAIMTRTDARNRAGQRLAKVLGFVRDHVDGQMIVWRWSNG